VGQYDVVSSEKVMHTFRLPRELVAMLKGDASQRGLDLTALIVRTTYGYLSYFGLPSAAAALLDADREKLGMNREEYLLHVLYQRSQDLREKGPGFDAPGRDRKKG
jgi:hypothetical protein